MGIWECQSDAALTQIAAGGQIPVCVCVCACVRVCMHVKRRARVQERHVGVVRAVAHDHATDEHVSSQHLRISGRHTLRAADVQCKLSSNALNSMQRHYACSRECATCARRSMSLRQSYLV